MIWHLRLKIRENLRKNWNAYEGFSELTFIKKYLWKLNNIQRVEYEKKFKTFTFKIVYSIKKSIILITKIIRIIITLIEFIISISFIKVKVEVDIKKFMCYNCNQIKHIKRDCSQSNKKTTQIYVIKMNNNDDDDLKDSSNDSGKD